MEGSGAAATATSALREQFDQSTYNRMNAVLDAIRGGVGQFVGARGREQARVNGAMQWIAQMLSERDRANSFGSSQFPIMGGYIPQGMPPIVPQSAAGDLAAWAASRGQPYIPPRHTRYGPD